MPACFLPNVSAPQANWLRYTNFVLTFQTTPGQPPQITIGKLVLYTPKNWLSLQSHLLAPFTLPKLRTIGADA